MKKLFMLLPLALGIVGCTTSNTPRYSASSDTVYTIRGMKLSEVATVGNFTQSATPDLQCRAVGPVTLPDGHTIPSYLQKAFEDELKLAGVFNPSNPSIVLTGIVDKVAFSSAKGFFQGEWELGLTIISSNGTRVSALERYDFDSAYLGDKGCQKTAEALVPATQNLLKKIVNDPGFKDLFKVADTKPMAKAKK